MATEAAVSRFDALYRTAEAQNGFFTRVQARDAGYSGRLLHHHVQRQRFQRWGRGIYRLAHFPQLTSDEDLVVYWLWSEKQGVFSHDTALMMYDVCDVLPERVSMTLPPAWQTRRLRVPPALRLRYAPVSPGEQGLMRGVPITSLARTLNDCARGFLLPDLMQQAVQEGLSRGLVQESEIEPALAYVHEQCG